MDQYLLLRDNKKSGPFTAAELATMGLKPYDLVWLEGKSAAWRYPAEIDELKSFAPAVEEQPYDRFYKKEQKPAVETAPEKSRDTVPKAPTKSTQQPIENTGDKRIFVSVPVTRQSVRKHSEPVVQSQSIIESVLAESSTVNKLAKNQIGSDQRRSVNKSIEHTDSTERRIEQISHKNVPAKTDGPRRFVYTSVAAMVVFVGLITFLFVNYQQQKQQLRKLNELVLNMQQNQVPETSPFNKNVVAKYPIDADAFFEDTSARSMKVEGVVSQQSSPSVPVIKQKVSVAALPEKQKKDSSNIHNKIDSVAVEVKDVPAERPSLKRDFNKKNLAQLVQVTPNKYKTGLLGGISDLKITLDNKSHLQLDKIQVNIEFLGPENKVVKTQSVVFENVSAGQDVTMDIPRSTRGVSVRCSVQSILKEDEVIALH